MMPKSKNKKIAVIASLLILIFIVLNFGLNIFLKYQLPVYVKNNTDYSVKYDKMDVDIGSGNVHITNLEVGTKQPDNLDVVFLEGKIKDLKVSRFGIWAALFDKTIYPSDIRVEKPVLKIRLAQKKKAVKKQTSKMTIAFDNLELVDGNIQVKNSRNSKVASLTNFSLLLTGFKKNDLTTDEGLPFDFDNFKLTGKQVFIRPTDDQLITAESIVSTNNGLSILGFKLRPLLSQKQFQKYYPEKKQQINLSAEGVFISDIKVKSKKLSLQNINIKNPDLTLLKGRGNNRNKQESSVLSVAMDSVLLANSKVRIVEFDGSTKFLVNNINVRSEGFMFDADAKKNQNPFQYKVFEVTGNNVQLDTDTESCRIGKLHLTPRQGFVSMVSVNNIKEVANKTALTFTANRMHYNINDWSVIDKKLKLDIKELVLDGLKGSAKTSLKVEKQGSKESGVLYPLKFGKIQLKNSDFTLVKNNLPLSVKGLNVVLNNGELLEKSNLKGTQLKVESYNFFMNDFYYKTKFYNISGASVKGDDKNLEINRFKMIPLYTRGEFIRRISVEQDLYTMMIPKIQMKGDWDFFSEKPFIKASQLDIIGLEANIFRSKIPRDDPKVKPMYSELLRGIKFPLQIASTNIMNSRLVYEEDTEKSSGPGKLVFSRFNMSISNLNSGKKGMATEIPIKINCQFMEVSPMQVNWTINTASMSDVFKINGTIASLPANHINAFIEPYLKVRATGSIQSLAFNLNGDKHGIKGNLRMKHKDLKVSILNKEGQKNKVLSSIANIFVKSNSKKIPESVDVEKVDRDPSKSFFNMFWKGIEAGLKKTLI